MRRLWFGVGDRAQVEVVGCAAKVVMRRSGGSEVREEELQLSRAALNPKRWTEA